MTYKLIDLSIKSISVGLVLSLSACATTGEPQTVQQRVAQCVAATAISAGLGAGIAALAGGDVSDGALIGAGAGAGLCAVWQIVDNEQDKRRIAEAQLAAIQQQEVVTNSWQNEQGKDISVTVTPGADAQMIPVSAATNSTTAADASPRLCRPVNTTLSVDGKTDQIGGVWCFDESVPPSGGWVASEQEMVAI